VRRVLLVVALLAAGASLLAQQTKKPAKPKPAPAPAFDESLPVLGTQLAELPPGPGKATADAACLKCHSADMLRQQRLNEKQWGAGVTKMVGWGADVPDAKRDELIAYLVKNFGPDNDRFKPVVTRPVGR
jgi:quinoprotein glucose dehydrogenase